MFCPVYVTGSLYVIAIGSEAGPWYDVSELRLDRKHSWSDNLSLLPEIGTDAVLCNAIQFPLLIIQFSSYRTCLITLEL
jgi:hypothetical protein